MKNLQTQIRKLECQHILYLVKITTPYEVFCKIGITTQTVEERMDYIECEDCTYSIIKELKCDGYQARSFESTLLEKILDFNKKYKPMLRFNGYTECYNIDYLPIMTKAFEYLEKRLKRITKAKGVKPKTIIKEIIKIKPDNRLISIIKYLDEENEFLKEQNNELDNQLEDLVDKYIITSKLGELDEYVNRIQYLEKELVKLIKELETSKN